MNESATPSAIPVYRAAAEAEVVRGAQFYRDTLRRIHAHLQPDVYLEIGVRHGFSLALAHARVAIGVDPIPELKAELGAHVRVVTTTSDEFFAGAAPALLAAPIDLAFIDGMHWFEFALRDFINVEQRATEDSAVIIDDIFPNHPLQAERERQSGVWTGDVWKLVPCLRKYRPELQLLLLDTNPSGLLVVTGLDPNSAVLRQSYAAIVEEFVDSRFALGAETLGRVGATDPDDPQLFAWLDELRARRQSAESVPRR